MAEHFQVDEINIYPVGSQILLSTTNVNVDYNKNISFRLPQGLIPSTLQVTDKDDQQLNYSLVPTKSIKKFLPLQEVEVQSKDLNVTGIYLHQDKKGIGLKLTDNTYMYIAQPDVIVSRRMYEIYPLISIFQLPVREKDEVESLLAHLNFLTKSLYWVITYNINLYDNMMKIRSQGRIINESEDSYSSKKIILYGGQSVNFPEDNSDKLKSMTISSKQGNLTYLTDDIVKIKQFEGSIPPREMIMSLNEYETPYDKYYRHSAGSKGAQILYRFKSSFPLMAGPATIYHQGKYIGSSFLAEHESGQIVDIVSGYIDLPISSIVSVLRRFKLNNKNSTEQNSKPSISPQLVSSKENGTTNDEIEGIKDKKEPTGIEVEEVSIKVSFTNPRREVVWVLLTYTAPGEILETNQETVRWFGNYIEWIPIKFKAEPQPQCVEIKLIQRIPPSTTRHLAPLP